MQTKSIIKWRRGVALAALAASCAIWSNPALAADEYVTDGAIDKCRPTDAVFRSSSGPARLNVYENTTDLEAWGFGMDFANGISDTSPSLNARIIDKKSGSDNSRRSGCPAQGSIGIRLASPTNLSAEIRADVTVRFPIGTWRLPVTVHPVVINTIRWDANATLAACLARNGGSLTVVNETRIVVRVPALLPRNTCDTRQRIIANLVPNSLINLKPLPTNFFWRVTDGANSSPLGSLRSALAADDNFNVTLYFHDLAERTPANERTHLVQFLGVIRKTLTVRTEVLPPFSRPGLR